MSMKGSTANRVGQTDSLGQPLAPGASTYGASTGAASIGDATDAMIRAGFIRKVYGILAIQLMATFGAMHADAMPMRCRCTPI